MLHWLWNKVFGAAEQEAVTSSAAPAASTPTKAAVSQTAVGSTDALLAKTKFEPKRVSAIKPNKSWSDKYQQVLKIHAKSGSLDPILTGDAHPELKKWVVNQREAVKLSQYCPTVMTKDQKSKLVLVDIIPSSKKGKSYSRFEKNFRAMQVFQAKYGHCRVPKAYDEDLFKWCRSLRRKYRAKTQGKSSALTDTQIEALEEIGFQWNGEAGRPSLVVAKKVKA